MSDLELRYFDIRGRGQAIRNFFNAKKTFIDTRIPLEANFATWSQICNDTSQVGMFKKLPILEVGKEQISEGLVILDYIHTHFGGGHSMPEKQNLQHAMLRSSLYQDLFQNVAVFLWADVALKGVDVAAYARFTLDRTLRLLESYDCILAEWEVTGLKKGEGYTMTDFLLAEGLDFAAYCFSSFIDWKKIPRLDEFRSTFSNDQDLKLQMGDIPEKFTGSPVEKEFVQRIPRLIQEK